MALGYTIGGILLVGGLLLGTGVVAALWLGVRAGRPELLRRPGRDE